VKSVILTAVVALVLGALPPALGQHYPSKPVRVGQPEDQTTLLADLLCRSSLIQWVSSS
jgi:hypothetical protein